MIGQRVRLARESCGLTQSELGDLAGLTQRAISDIESGRKREPPASAIERVAQVTGFPRSFFYRGPLPDLPDGFYRKLASVPSKLDKQIRAQARQIVEIIQRADKRYKLPSVAVKPITRLGGSEGIEALAASVRRVLGIGGLDRIGNVMRAVERAGVVVVRLPGRVHGHDSFSVWPDYGLKGRPLIVLTAGHSGDRDRFTVGHELGHLIMHSERRGIERKDAEAEASRFAGALLLPRDAAIEEMSPPITLRVLMGVKASYGLSIAAGAKRAFDLNLISQPHYESLHKQLSARKWKRQEPIDVPQERPVLVSKIIAALGGDGPVPERAERVGMQVFAFQALVSMGQFPFQVSHSSGEKSA